MPAGVDVIDVPTAVGLCVRGDCEAVGQRSPGQLGEVVVLPLGGRLRALAELVNVPELVNEMDVLAAVTFCAYPVSTLPVAVVLAGVPAASVVSSLSSHWAAGCGLLESFVNVPELVNEMDVLAGVRLRVPGKYVAGSWRAGWGSGGQRGGRCPTHWAAGCGLLESSCTCPSWSMKWTCWLPSPRAYPTTAGAWVLLARLCRSLSFHWAAGCGLL